LYDSASQYKNMFIKIKMCLVQKRYFKLIKKTLSRYMRVY